MIHSSIAALTVTIVSLYARKRQAVKGLDDRNIPLGTRCSEPMFGDGVTPTRTIVERVIGKTVGTAFNEDQVVAAAEKRFGLVLPKLEYIQLESDFDETGIARLNGVYLRKR